MVRKEGGKHDEGHKVKIWNTHCRNMPDDEGELCNKTELPTY